MQAHCKACEYKPRCCPKVPRRKIPRSIYVSSREVARAVSQTPEYKKTRRQRKKVEMLFAHLKRISKPDRLRLRGMSGAHVEFLLAATTQNLRRMAKCSVKHHQATGWVRLHDGKSASLTNKDHHLSRWWHTKKITPCQTAYNSHDILPLRSFPAQSAVS